MRKIYILLFILTFSSCKEEKALQAVKEVRGESIENFDWLLGNWQRTNEQEGRETYENWKRINDLEYEGFGFTLHEQDTIWQENIRLIKIENLWNFEVKGKGEFQPTVFVLTTAEANKFVAENPDNEFPKVISYSGKENKLSATISAGDTGVLFEFERVQ